MYLTEAAIDASLRAIASWSAVGSELAMTYMERSRTAPPSLATRAVTAVVDRLGEPFKFGWDPAELPEYLAARGFELVRDVTTTEAARALMPPDHAAHVTRADSRNAFARRTAPP